MAKTYIAVQAIGRDTPGIAAELTGVLYGKFHCNIEMSQMTILGGHFAVTVIASSEMPLDGKELERALASPGPDSAVRSVYVSELKGDHFHKGGREASHSIMLQASERSGLLHQVSQALADRGVNIAALASSCSPEQESLCSMAMDVVLPAEMGEDDLREILRSAVEDEIFFEIGPTATERRPPEP